MATNVLANCKAWLAEYDLSSDLNAVAIEQGVEQQDATVFGLGTKITKPGLLTVKAVLAGLLNTGAGLSEEFLSSKLALPDVPFTAGPTTGAEGEPAFSFLAALAKFDPLASVKVGDLGKIAVEMEATNARLVRGTILHNAARTTTGTGTIFNLGAVAAGQAVYGALHVPAISGGPTVTIKVQSAPTGGFAAPVDRLTF